MKSSDDDFRGGMIVGIIICLAAMVLFILVFDNVSYDHLEDGIVTINDLEVGYSGTACKDGLLRFRRAHIRTGTGIGIAIKNWVSPVLCEE